MAEVTDWKKLTIPLLKQELASRSLDVKGRKSDLVSRLEQSDRAFGGDPGTAEEDIESSDLLDTTGEDVDDGGDDSEIISEENNEEEEEEEAEELDGEEADTDECLLEEGNAEEGDMEELVVDEGMTEESLLEENGADVSQSEEKNIGVSPLVMDIDGQNDESLEKKDTEQDVSFEMETLNEAGKDEPADTEVVEGKQKEGKSSSREVLDGEAKDRSVNGDDGNDMELDEEEEEREAEEKGEKKKETLKRFDLATLYIPKVDEIHKDLQVAQKFRVLYIYPLRTEMMGDPAVMAHFEHASSMPCKFYPTDTPEGKVYEGYLILRFEFSEDALQAMSGLREVLPDSVNIHVRQPSQTHKDMLSAFNRSEPQGIEPWIKDNKNTKVVFVGNLPPTATEAALKEIFTGATIIRIAREDDSSSKGYAIVGYDNEKDAEHAAKEHMCAIIDNYVLAVLYLSQASNRPAVDKEFYVDRTKLLEELKKFEEEIGLSSAEKKKESAKKESAASQRKTSQVVKKPAVSTQRKVVNKEPSVTRVKKESTTSKASKEVEKNGEATEKSTEGSEADKKPGERVRRSRWSNEGEKNRPQPQVLEKLQQLQKKWERPPERQRDQRDQRRSGDTRTRRSWNVQRSSSDNKRSYTFRPDREDKRYRTGRSLDEGRMTNYKPRMQSSLDAVYQQGGGLAMGGGPAVGVGVGMAQGGGMGMVGGMGMGGGMTQGGGMVMGGGMGMGMGMGNVMGQPGGMAVGGGMGMGGGMGVGAVPSLLSPGQVGGMGGRQPMMQSNVMGAGAGVGGGMGRGPGVNLLLGLTQILSKQLSNNNQPPARRRERVRARSHSDTRR